MVSCTSEIMDASETTYCGKPPTHPNEKPIITSDSSSEMTDPSDGITDPSDGITDPSDGITDPSDGITDPSDGITDPSDGVTDPSDGITDPSDRITDPADETTDPSDDTSSISDQLPTHPMHKGIWFDPAEFVWAIGDNGRKMLIAGFLSLKYFPSEIATVFNRGPYHDKLSAQFEEKFACNAHDVVNAYLYMVKKGNVEWQQKFSEEKREVWEADYELRAELQGWVDELRKGINLESCVDADSINLPPLPHQ